MYYSDLLKGLAGVRDLVSDVGWVQNVFRKKDETGKVLGYCIGGACHYAAHWYLQSLSDEDRQLRRFGHKWDLESGLLSALSAVMLLVDADAETNPVWPDGRKKAVHIEFNDDPKRTREDILAVIDHATKWTKEKLVRAEEVA